MKLLMKLITVAALVAIASPALAKTYKLDTSHTIVGFEIDHMVISSVEGRFNGFGGTFDYDADKGTLSNVNIEIDAASIDTNSAKRDKHLKSEDFFNVPKYPTLTFVSSGSTKVKNGKAEVKGKLTMHGVTKDIVLKVKIKGTATNPWGTEVLAFEATTDDEIVRKDYGLTYNSTLETGGVLIGEEVTVEIKGEANPAK